MTQNCWAHVFVGQDSSTDVLEKIPSRFDLKGMVTVLDGQEIRSLSEFYSAIPQAVPLLTGFGCNLNALDDLFSTFGTAELAGGSHAFVWLAPERMLAHAPEDFWTMADIIVGAAKQLLIGDEFDPSFDPTDEEDWIPTRLLVAFVCRDPKVAQKIAKRIACLCQYWWKETFRSLEIDVELHEEPL